MCFVVEVAVVVLLNSKTSKPQCVDYLLYCIGTLSHNDYEATASRIAIVSIEKKFTTQETVNSLHFVSAFITASYCPLIDVSSTE